MLELKFTLYHMSVLFSLALCVWSVTLAALAVESLTQATAEAPDQILLWIDDKASSPCVKIKHSIKLLSTQSHLVYQARPISLAHWKLCKQ